MGVERDAGWVVKSSLCGGSAVARVGRDAVARDGGDDARGGVDEADAVIV